MPMLLRPLTRGRLAMHFMAGLPQKDRMAGLPLKDPIVGLLLKDPIVGLLLKDPMAVRLKALTVMLRPAPMGRGLAVRRKARLARRKRSG